MIGQAGELNTTVVTDFLTIYLPQLLIGLAIGGSIGWWLGQRLASRLATVPGEHGWLVRFPGQPMLLLVAVVLPFLELPWLITVIAMTVLVVLPVLLISIQYHNVFHPDERQQRLDRQALLRTRWKDTGFLGASFLLSGLAVLVLLPEADDSVVEHLENLPLALLVAVVVGLALGVMLGWLQSLLAARIQDRHARDAYGLGLIVLERTRNAIEILPTQFHGTQLTGVLIICAAALPFTALAQTGILILLLIPPVVSAVLSAMLVEDDLQPGKPDEWHHWRLGLANLMQICIGYMVGAAMLIPLDKQNDWMLSDSDEVIRQLNTHLELTFIALGISMLLGIGGGLISSRVERLRTLLINLGNVGRTIPSLAVLALALPIFGVGRDPSLVALVFIGTLPILVNTTVGIISVSHELKEAARGMGMHDLQVLLEVEIPVAIPVIMAGIRTSAVLVVASATLAGFIGGGGLGALIIRGDGSGREDILITGAVMATMLSIFLEYFFGWLEKLLTPRGLREA